jgi:ATP-dependent RNA helicase DDX55/SPB4
MPELREGKGKLVNFKSAGPDVNIFAIPYLDKSRESARQRRLKEELATGGKNAKQIKAEQRKAEERRHEQERRQKAIEKGRNPDKKRGRHQQIVDEWDDLAKEERLYKKLRRGKINKDQYETLIRGGTAESLKKGTASDDDSASEDDSD